MQEWEEEHGQQEVAEAVGAHLELVALGACAAGGWEGDAGVVEEHIETGCGGEEGCCGFGNCGEVGEVQREIG